MPSLFTAGLLAASFSLLSNTASGQAYTATPGVIPQWYPSRYCGPLSTSEEFGDGPKEGEEWGAKWNPLIEAQLKSPYPCEQVQGLQMICSTNGTSDADFIAEKQCFCGGNYWEASIGCDKCWRANGWVQEGLSHEDVEAGLKDEKKKFCNASPHAGRPFKDTLTILSEDAVRPASVVSSAIISYQNTEVFYWAGDTTAVAGAYSGEATGRQQTFTQIPPYTEVYTPTFTPAELTATSTAAASETSKPDPTDDVLASSLIPSSLISNPTTAKAGAPQITGMGGMAALAFGAMLVL